MLLCLIVTEQRFQAERNCVDGSYQSREHELMRDPGVRLQTTRGDGRDEPETEYKEELPYQYVYCFDVHSCSIVLLCI